MDFALDFVEQIERHTRALVGLADGTDGSAAVPACPGWTLDDLLWHLFEVQHFWNHVIAERPEPPATYEPPNRSTTTLPTALDDVCASLVRSLRAADPAEAAWSWSGAEHQNVGFTMRRQAHEAWVHLNDGILAAGEDRPELDRAFAVDGLDEALSVFIAGNPDWSEFVPGDEVVEVRASDGPERFTMRFGRQVGVRPRDNASIDAPALELITSTAVEPGALVLGSADELHLWLWGRRPASAVATSGNAELLARFEEIRQACTR